METLINFNVECRKCGESTQLMTTSEQLTELYLPRGERRLMQEIFPDLSIEDRELLISGTCNTCWQNMFGSCEDEEE